MAFTPVPFNIFNIFNPSTPPPAGGGDTRGVIFFFTTEKREEKTRKCAEMCISYSRNVQFPDFPDFPDFLYLV